MNNTVIVVEGKNDKSKLQNIFPDATIVITNGSEISNDTLGYLKALSLNSKIILCLDPDFPGNQIRQKITNAIPNTYNVYAEKEKAISKNKKKVGIEHMSKNDILDMFKNIYQINNKGTITFQELYDLGLMDNKQKREKLCKNLSIGYCNAKQLVKRLNALNIELDEVRMNL